MNYWSGLNAVGSTMFDGSVTGLGLADLLIGNARSFNQGTTYGFYTRQYYESLYAQDTWKANRRLTLNYGVRWEPYVAPSSKWGQIHFVDPKLFAQGYRSEEHTSELQSRLHLVCRLLLEKKNST